MSYLHPSVEPSHLLPNCFSLPTKFKGQMVRFFNFRIGRRLVRVFRSPMHAKDCQNVSSFPRGPVEYRPVPFMLEDRNPKDTRSWNNLVVACPKGSVAEMTRVFSSHTGTRS